MPVSHRYDGRIVIMQMHGQYTTAELREGILSALKSDDTPENPVMLFDLRESTSLRDRTPADIRGISQFLVAHGDLLSRTLAMVVSDDVGFGRIRMGSTEAEWGGIKPMVFRHFDEADAWLTQQL